MVSKAVIPAAGFGTRFLPATKSQPKEMLPVVDTPTIQYVVEEAVASGITDILMVIGKGKRAIEEHFDRNFELEAELAEKGKTDELRAMRHISSMANIHFVWQQELKGLGDAVLHARDHVGDDPFAVLLGDTLIESETPVTKQLIEIFDRYHEPVVALEEVERSKVSRYGVIAGKNIAEDLYLITDFIEKPSVEEAPSNLAIAGRYVFTAEVFEYIEGLAPGKNDEIQLTDAMRLMAANRPVAPERGGLRIADCGMRNGQSEIRNPQSAAGRRGSRPGSAGGSLFGPEPPANAGTDPSSTQAARRGSRPGSAGGSLLDPDARLNGGLHDAGTQAARRGSRPMYGLRFNGRRYDLGNRLDFLKTNLIFGLKRDDLRDGLREFIAEIVREA